MWCGVILTNLLENIKFCIMFVKDVCKESDEIIFASKREEMKEGCMKLHNKSVYKISVEFSSE